MTRAGGSSYNRRVVHERVVGRARGDDGAAVLEFAILLPFLAIFVFGTIDLARAWQLRNRLTNAAREGAAYGQFFPQYVNSFCNGGNSIRTHAQREDANAVTNPGTQVTVKKRVKNLDGTYTLTEYNNGASDSSSCTQPPRSVPGGSAVTFDRANNDGIEVTVEDSFDVLTPLVAIVVGDTLTVQGTSQVVIQ